MTRMPPEMSTTNTPTMTMPLPPTQQPHESLSAIQQTRSRFMINDILAGQQQQQQQHHHQHQHLSGNLATTQQQLALQHYLSQHHQQQQQQQQKQYFIPIPTDSQAALRHFPQQHPHLLQANVYPPHTALMGLTPVGMQALQQQQQQQQQQQNQRHERDNGADFDERSRSPLSGSANKANNGNSSLIDDQASTIDDSDSECK